MKQTHTIPEAIETDFRTFVRQVRLHGVLITQTALRVGAGRSSDIVGEDLPVVKDALHRPVIPGSSVKGAVRAYTESILRSLAQYTDAPEDAPLLSCDPLVEPCIPPEKVKAIKAGGDDVDAQLYAHTCWACRVFGAPWLASRVLVKDLPVDDEFWFAHFGHRDGVSIDRDTATAGDKRRYTYEVVPENTRFSLDIVVDGVSTAELGLFILALEGLCRGDIPLGGARSRGLGAVTLALDWGHVEVSTPANALEVFGARALKLEVPRAVWTQADRDEWILAFLTAIHIPDDIRGRWQQARQEVNDAE